MTIQFEPQTRAIRPPAVPPGLIPLAIVVFLIGGFGPNLDLAILSIAVLIAGSVLLWRPGETPVLLYTFGFGWLGASIEIFNSNWAGRSLEFWTDAPSEMRWATILSLLGVLAVAAGARLGAGLPTPYLAAQARLTAQSQPMSTGFKLYVLASLLGYAAAAVIWTIPGLAQLILGLIAIKWTFFYMLAFAAFVSGQSKQWYWLAFAFEMATGISSFFSDFKTPLILSLLAFVASGIRASPRYVFAVGAFASLAFGLGIVWTAIKGEYRSFVSGGTGAHAVTVSYADSMDKIIDLVLALRGENLVDGADRLIQRVSYVTFFGATLRYVPLLEPHTDGEILADAISRPFMPRILFPSKTEIDDTQRTNRYTGGLAGTEVQSTSISLGYVAEMYIDFGMVWMFPALVLIGWIYGATYRLMIRGLGVSSFLGMGYASMTLFGVASLDNSFTKVFGGLIAVILVVVILSKIVFPRWPAFRFLLR